MMLSEHFSLEELTASEVAARAGIDNTPSSEAMRNLLRLAEGLEMVRAALDNNAIHVTSGYRSLQLNQMVGGSKNSMHIEGLAADIICAAFGPPLGSAAPSQRRASRPIKSSTSSPSGAMSASPLKGTPRETNCLLLRMQPRVSSRVCEVCSAFFEKRCIFRPLSMIYMFEGKNRQFLSK